MFRRKPPKVPDESKPPVLELHEVPGLIFAFLWFHRNIIFAGAILWGLYNVLALATEKVERTRENDSEIPTVLFTSPDQEINSFESIMRPRPSSVRNLPSERPLEQPKAVPKKSLRLPEDPAAARFRDFVNSADVDELIRRVKLLSLDLTKVTSSDAVARITRRQMVCRRLREMDLSSEQLIELEIAELESLSQLDALNVQHHMELMNARIDLTQAADRLQKHDDPRVYTKAHLAIMAAAGIDVVVDPTREEMHRLTDIYNLHIDKIMEGVNETAVVANLFLLIVERHQLDESIALRDDLLSRALNHSSPEIQRLGALLQEKVIFGDLGLATLMTRMDTMTPMTLKDIDSLFTCLANHPNARRSLYQIALAVVGKHIQYQDFDSAAHLAQRLGAIETKILDIETRQLVHDGLERFSEKISAAHTGL